MREKVVQVTEWSKKQPIQLYPLSIKKALIIKGNHHQLLKFLEIYDLYIANDNPFLKDVLNDYRHGSYMPLNYNEILQYHTRSECIKGKYKKANPLAISWNKRNMNLSYLIIKSLPYVSEAGKQKLLQIKDDTILRQVPTVLDYKDKVESFLALCIVQNLKREIANKKEIEDICETGVLQEELDEQYYNIARDYVHMCMKSKEKVSLSIKTRKSLENRHNQISENQYKKQTGKVNIPKDSKFNKLREILPPEFEWIKTRKRLICETELQHHCVWSYADFITNDQSAIYSFVDKEGQYSLTGVPGRYTIEFKMVDGKYVIKQTQGRYDRVNTDLITTYIKSFLEKQHCNQDIA